MNQSKNIALIVPGGFGTGKNNLGIPVLEQIVILLSQNFKVTVFQLYEVNKNYKAHGFELFGFRNNSKVGQYFKFFLCFIRGHRKKNFDVVHGFWVWPCGFLAVVLGKILKIKSVVSVLGGDGSSVPEINYGYLHRPIYRKLILWTLHHANEANALTNYLVDNLKRAGLKRELEIIPWGIDSEMFSFKEKPLNRPVRFLHIGNFHAVKDQPTLLRVFARITKSVDCTLTMIGEGNEEQRIRNLIEELGIQKKVRILYHMPYPKLVEFYHESDILLHTSLSEGQSEVVTEAMSCGLLVCGTKVGLLYDLPVCCITVGLKDFQGLADKILPLINDGVQINSIRQRGKEWVSKHNINWTVKEISKKQYKLFE
ncbi:MAG: glycosyltransferase [Bacteroidetes bacterium]|nr:glycosyltransferase [Bacteroidota bacterium]MBI3482301.1 glycosyltransferase [Bacteroidota bacterium]